MSLQKGKQQELWETVDKLTCQESNKSTDLDAELTLQSHGPGIHDWRIDNRLRGLQMGQAYSLITFE